MTGGFEPAADEVEARLLGQARSLRRREVSSGAGLSLRSARKFWHALGFANVDDDEDRSFTQADVVALRSVADLVREGVLEKYEVELIAASRAAIDMAEDRELFRNAMRDIGLETPQ